VHLDLPEDIALSCKATSLRRQARQVVLPIFSGEIVRTLSGALGALAAPVVDHGVEFHAQPSGG